MASPLTVWSTTADGKVRGYNASYSTARSTAQLASTTNTTEELGQQWDTSNYFVFETFTSFDTSSVGSGSTVTTATFSLYGSTDSSVTDFTIRARIRDWGASLTTGDWVAGDDLDTYTLVAHLATSAFATGAYNDFTDDALPANIAKTGTTYIMSHSDRQEDTGGGPYTPTGNEHVFVRMADDATGVGGTDRDPKLYVEWTEGASTKNITASSSFAFAESAVSPLWSTTNWHGVTVYRSVS